MMYDLIYEAQRDDKNAMMELITRFQPLLRKYARKLGYEDAYEDTVLYFIQLVKSINLDRLKSQKDEVMVSYINVSIRNFYNKKIVKFIESKKEIMLSDLTQEQLYYVEVQSAKQDKTNIFIEFALQNLLNENERQLIQLVYVEGYSTTEVARMWMKSRQAVNQIKLRALNKLKKIAFTIS